MILMPKKNSHKGICQLPALAAGIASDEWIPLVTWSFLVTVSIHICVIVVLDWGGGMQVWFENIKGILWVQQEILAHIVLTENDDGMDKHLAMGITVKNTMWWMVWAMSGNILCLKNISNVKHFGFFCCRNKLMMRLIL